MGRRTNYGFEKRQKELKRQKKREKKLEERREQEEKSKVEKDIDRSFERYKVFAEDDPKPLTVLSVLTWNNPLAGGSGRCRARCHRIIQPVRARATASFTCSLRIPASSCSVRQ